MDGRRTLQRNPILHLNVIELIQISWIHKINIVIKEIHILCSSYDAFMMVKLQLTNTMPIVIKGDHHISKKDLQLSTTKKKQSMFYQMNPFQSLLYSTVHVSFL